MNKKSFEQVNIPWNISSEFQYYNSKPDPLLLSYQRLVKVFISIFNSNNRK